MTKQEAEEQWENEQEMKARPTGGKVKGGKGTAGKGKGSRVKEVEECYAQAPGLVRTSNLRETDSRRAAVVTLMNPDPQVEEPNGPPPLAIPRPHPAQPCEHRAPNTATPAQSSLSPPTPTPPVPAACADSTRRSLLLSGGQQPAPTLSSPPQRRGQLPGSPPASGPLPRDSNKQDVEMRHLTSWFMIFP